MAKKRTAPLTAQERKERNSKLSRQGCVGKMPFTKAAAIHVQRDRRNCRAYRCPHCMKWHIATKRKSIFAERFNSVARPRTKRFQVDLLEELDGWGDYKRD